MNKKNIFLFMPPLYKKKKLNHTHQSIKSFEDFIGSPINDLTCVPFPFNLEQIEKADAFIIPGLSVTAFQENIELTAQYFLKIEKVLKIIFSLKNIPILTFCMGSFQAILQLNNLSYSSLLKKSLFKPHQREMILSPLKIIERKEGLYKKLSNNLVNKFEKASIISVLNSRSLIPQTNETRYKITSYYLRNKQWTPASLEVKGKPIYCFLYNPLSVLSHEKRTEESLKHYSFLRNYFFNT